MHFGCLQSMRFLVLVFGEQNLGVKGRLCNIQFLQTVTYTESNVIRKVEIVVIGGWLRRQEGRPVNVYMYNTLGTHTVIITQVVIFMCPSALELMINRLERFEKGGYSNVS